MHMLKGFKILVLSFCFILVLARGDGGGGTEELRLEEPKKIPTFSEMIRSSFAFFGTASSPLPGGSYWDQVKQMINQVLAYFFPPNLDFRGGNEVRAKEAVAKSVETGKKTLEDSAKSAAKIASDTIHKTQEKVKRSLSEQGETQPHGQGEL